jgi:hypothetical protein
MKKPGGVALETVNEMLPAAVVVPALAENGIDTVPAETELLA